MMRREYKRLERMEDFARSHSSHPTGLCEILCVWRNPERKNTAMSNSKFRTPNYETTASAYIKYKSIYINLCHIL